MATKVPNGPRAQEVTDVCLFSWHPLLSSEFQRLLPEEEFRLLDHRIENPSGEPGQLKLPQAAVYVVEAAGQPQGTEALIAAIAREFPARRVVVICERLDEPHSFSLLSLGVKGLLKYTELSYLARALRVVAGGGFWVPRTVLSRFVDAALEAPRRPVLGVREEKLSHREREVAALLLENLSNKEIAVRLQISERTAKFHVSNLLAKCGVKRRADLILLWFAESKRA